MARTINQIYAGIVQSIIDNAALVGYTVNPNAWSKYDLKKMIAYSVASAISIFEQLFDSFKSDVEERIKDLPPQTKPWFKDKMLNLFEYDATAVPVVQLDTNLLIPYYPNSNIAYRIVKYCSVVSGSFGTTLIKAAAQSSGFPLKLTAPQIAAAQSFVDTIGVPGIKYTVLSLDSDKLFLQLDVYYNGAYAAVIQQRVIDAINGYLRSIPFDGKIKVSNLEAAIKAVDGVGYDGDVVFVNVRARQDTSTAGTGTDLVSNNTEVLREWPTIAGYIIPETSAGFLLTDLRTVGGTVNNLNLIAQ